MKHFFTLLLIVAIRQWVPAQLQPQQSQYQFNSLPVNPAVAGYREALSINLSSRSMWSGVEGAPRTLALAAHTPFAKDKLGIGLLVQNDQIGITRTNGLYANLVYRVSMLKGKLGFGLRGGMVNRIDRWSSVITTQSGDQAFDLGNQQSWLPDAGAGVFYYTKVFNIGISAPSVFRTRYIGGGDYTNRADIRSSTLIAHMGALLRTGGSIRWQPTALVRYQSALPLQADLGLIMNFREVFGIGGSVRPGSSWSGLIRIFATKQLSMVYSYDYYNSKLNRPGRGAHEVTLLYDFIQFTHAPGTKFF